MMFRGWDHPLSTDMPTDVELRSAFIAYSRPRGNTDLDVDPEPHVARALTFNECEPDSDNTRPLHR